MAAQEAAAATRNHQDSLIELAASRLADSRNIHDQSLAAVLRSSVTNYRWALDLAHNVIEQLAHEVIEQTTGGDCGDYPAPCNCDDPSTHSGH